MIVLIDDERSFKKEFVKENTIVLRSSKEALKWLEGLKSEDVIDQLWFDHDLGLTPNGVKDSTIPVLGKLEELCFFGKAPAIKEVIVHTSNNVGGNTIENSMKRYFKTIRVFAGDYLVGK